MKVHGSTQLAVVKVGKCRCITREAVSVPCKRSLSQTHDIKTHMNAGCEALQQRVQQSAHICTCASYTVLLKTLTEIQKG